MTDGLPVAGNHSPVRSLLLGATAPVHMAPAVAAGYRPTATTAAG